MAITGTTASDTISIASPDATGERPAPVLTVPNDTRAFQENQVVEPFVGITLTDATPDAVETLTFTADVELLRSSGRTPEGPPMLAGPGLTESADGTFRITGTADEVTAALQKVELTTNDLPGRFAYETLAFSFTDVSHVDGTADMTAVAMAQVYNFACYAAGTQIATARGEVPVEDLRVGDAAILATGGTAPIVWIGHRRTRRADPVRVVAGAFGPGLPARDLVLSPEHALFLDGHLVPVQALVDGVSVIREAWERVIYYHVELDRHGVLLAEGLPAESYLDTGNRASFANGALVTLHADFGPGGESAASCAPLVLVGPVVEAQRAGLRAIALDRGCVAA